MFMWFYTTRLTLNTSHQQLIVLPNCLSASCRHVDVLLPADWRCYALHFIRNFEKCFKEKRQISRSGKRSGFSIIVGLVISSCSVGALRVVVYH